MVATVADMPFALGRKPSPPDPRTLRLANYTTAGDVLTAPRSANWMRRVRTWPLYSNDRIGDCVFAAYGHLTQAWTRYAGTEVTLPEQDIIGAYSAATGYDPTTGAGDDGAVMRDALNFWRKTGIGGRNIDAYVSVDVGNHDEVRYAAHTFGGLAVGIDMPLVAGDQFRKRMWWTPTSGPDGERGSWGGHAVHVGAYSSRSLTCTTWGGSQHMTWGFWDSYVSEAYAVLSPDWLTAAKGVSPTGLDLSDLLADLQRITAN